MLETIPFACAAIARTPTFSWAMMFSGCLVAYSRHSIGGIIYIAQSGLYRMKESVPFGDEQWNKNDLQRSSMNSELRADRELNRRVWESNVGARRKGR